MMMEQRQSQEHQPDGPRIAPLGRPVLVTESSNRAELDVRSLMSLQSAVGNQAVAALVLRHAKLPVQRVEVDAGTKVDAGQADAGTAAAAGGLTRTGGDKASKKIVFVSWTFDDGPTPQVTEAMAKVSPAKGGAPVPGTWFIMRNQIKSPEDLKALKAKQDAGQEFGIHSMHLTESHFAWFPQEKDSYPDVNTAMTQLKTFLVLLQGEGLVIHFVRVPFGLMTEIHNYLGVVGVAKHIVDSKERSKRLNAITRAIITGQPIPPEHSAAPARQVGEAAGRDAGMAAAAGTPALGGMGAVAGVDAGLEAIDASVAAAAVAADAAGIAKVTADFTVMKQTLSSLGLHEWGGKPQEDPGVQGWEAESEPKEVSDPKEIERLYGKDKFRAMADDAVKVFENTINLTAKDGGPHSVVILAHDTKVPKTKVPIEGGDEGFKRPQHVAQDMLTMEAYALDHGVQIQYCTMSELYEKRVQAKP